MIEQRPHSSKEENIIRDIRVIQRMYSLCKVKIGMIANVSNSKLWHGAQISDSKFEAEVIRNKMKTTLKRNGRRVSNFADIVGEVDYPEGRIPMPYVLFSCYIIDKIRISISIIGSIVLGFSYVVS